MEETLKPQAEYLAHLVEGRFMLQRSRRTGEYVFYPRAMAPGTGARDLEWVPASGAGTVHAVTIIRPKPPEKPYNVVLVELAEGPRLMSRVDGADPAIGMAVRADIATENGASMLVFVPT